MIWLIPAALALLAVVPLAVLARGVARELKALRRELAALAAVREPVLELRADVEELRAGMPEIRFRTRPPEPAAS